MSDWRDDLPPIPADRIREDAIRDGTRRRHLRHQRQVATVYGVGAVIVIGAVGALIATGSIGVDDDDGASAPTTGVAGATAGTTAGTSGTTAGGAESTAPASGTTTAPGTSAAPATTGGAATTAPVVGPTIGPVPDQFGGPASGISDYTTIGGPIAALPPSAAVEVPIEQVWEDTCEESLLVVWFTPEGLTPIAPVVHWETAGRRGEGPMFLSGDRAEAAIGPFPGDMVEDDGATEVLVYITDAEASGDQIFRAPTIVLNGC